jgi:hypothetical protein
VDFLKTAGVAGAAPPRGLPRRGSILMHNRAALQIRACLCNKSVKNQFKEVLRGVYPATAAEIDPFGAKIS